jgi:hypothetical protein
MNQKTESANIDDLQIKIKKLEDRIDTLEGRRLLQQDFLPGCVKNRAMGEANSYLYAGVASKRPTGAKFGNNVTYYYATDTDVFYIWDGISWNIH